MEKLVFPISSEIKDELYKMANAQFSNFKRVKIQNGQTVFKMQIETLDISPAKVTVEKSKNDKGITIRNYKIKHEAGYIYIVALNEKNATKKLTNVVYTAALYANVNQQKPASSLIQGDNKESKEIKPNTP